MQNVLPLLNVFSDLRYVATPFNTMSQKDKFSSKVPIVQKHILNIKINTMQYKYFYGIVLLIFQKEGRITIPTNKKSTAQDQHFQSYTSASAFPDCTWFIRFISPEFLYFLLSFGVLSTTIKKADEDRN